MVRGGVALEQHQIFTVHVVFTAAIQAARAHSLVVSALEDIGLAVLAIQGLA